MSEDTSWVQPGASAVLLRTNFRTVSSITAVHILRVGKRDIVLEGSEARPRVCDLEVPRSGSWNTVQTILCKPDDARVLRGRAELKASDAAFAALNAAEAWRRDPFDVALAEKLRDVVAEYLASVV